MNAKPLHWQDLHFFLATARGGSLTAAAGNLGVNASTVHRRLAALESTLDTRLFSRSARGYALTGAGAELLEHALAIEAEVLHAERRVGGRDQSVSGLIRVSTVDDLALFVLSPLLGEFCKRHPRVRLDVAIDSDLADLARRQADVAIRPGAPPKGSDLIARRVCGIAVALYAGRSYVARQAPPETLERLREHPIVRADTARAHLAMERFLDAYVEPDGAAFRSNSMLARLAAIRDGVGIGLLPCITADAEPALIRLGQAIPEAAASLWILIHADMRRSARVRALVESVHGGLADLQQRFEAQ